MKAKFEKGQIVKIKKIEDIHNTKMFPTFIVDMHEYCNTEGKITWLWRENKYPVFYIYQIHGWTWREDWICAAEFLTNKDFEI